MLSLGQYFVIVLSTYFEEDVINLVWFGLFMVFSPLQVGELFCEN